MDNNTINYKMIVPGWGCSVQTYMYCVYTHLTTHTRALLHTHAGPVALAFGFLWHAPCCVFVVLIPDSHSLTLPIIPIHHPVVSAYVT